MKKNNSPILTPIALILFAFILMASTADDRKDRVRECATKAGEGAIYLKEFVVSLEKGQKGEKPPMYRQGY
jgi:hypothetical protein